MFYVDLESSTWFNSLNCSKVFFCRSYLRRQFYFFFFNLDAFHFFLLPLKSLLYKCNLEVSQWIWRSFIFLQVWGLFSMNESLLFRIFSLDFLPLCSPKFCPSTRPANEMFPAWVRVAVLLRTKGGSQGKRYLEAGCTPALPLVQGLNSFQFLPVFGHSLLPLNSF